MLASDGLHSAARRQRDSQSFLRLPDAELAGIGVGRQKDGYAEAWQEFRVDWTFNRSSNGGWSGDVGLIHAWALGCLAASAACSIASNIARAEASSSLASSRGR